jgi:hypothetical protein
MDWLKWFGPLSDPAVFAQACCRSQGEGGGVQKD